MKRPKKICAKCKVRCNGFNEGNMCTDLKAHEWRDQVSTGEKK